MNQNLPIPFESALERVSLPAWLRMAGTVVLGSAFLAACAHVAIPLWFTPVPLTLQPFGVLVLGLLLSPQLAAGTVAAYLLEGALGLPVFAPTAALGLMHLLGPTGGYLLAYPAAALLIALAARRAGSSFTLRMAAAALGDLMILCGGALWLALSAHISLTAAFALAVVPFLPGDALKVSAAAAVSSGLRRCTARQSRRIE